MHPKDRAQMMAYMLRSGIKDQVKFASDVAKPVDKFEVQQIKLFNRFNRDYPNKKADGGRIPNCSNDPAPKSHISIHGNLRRQTRLKRRLIKIKTNFRPDH